MKLDEMKAWLVGRTIVDTDALAFSYEGDESSDRASGCIMLVLDDGTRINDLEEFIWIRRCQKI